MDGDRAVRILGFSGSARLGSINSRLLESAASMADATVATVAWRVPALPLFSEDLEAHAFAAGEVADLVERVRQADALLLATPEYNHSFPALLKNALDWLSRPGAGGVLVGKPVAVIGASTGRWGTRLAQAALRQVLLACEMRLVGRAPLYVAGASATMFDDHGRLADHAIASALIETLASLADASRTARAHGRRAHADEVA